MTFRSILISAVPLSLWDKSSASLQSLSFFFFPTKLYPRLKGSTTWPLSFIMWYIGSPGSRPISHSSRWRKVAGIQYCPKKDGVAKGQAGGLWWAQKSTRVHLWVVLPKMRNSCSQNVNENFGVLIFISLTQKCQQVPVFMSFAYSFYRLCSCDNISIFSLVNHCTLFLRVYNDLESQDAVFADVAPLLTSLLDG